jgi:hypothetical protein
MGLFGGSSKSTSSQDIDVFSSNQQGIGGDSIAAAGKQLNQTEAPVAWSHGISVGAGSEGIVAGRKSTIKIKNANSTDLAEIMGNVSIAALDYYDRQNERSLDIANEVAKATTSANKDIINEFAAITEKSNQSESLTLNEQLLKWGVFALFGGLVYMGLNK